MRPTRRVILWLAATSHILACAVAGASTDAASAAERQRIEMIDRIAPAVVCIYDSKRRGGGSGVLIDEDGYGLTNYHVVAGMLETRRGWGGLSDGKLYPLEVLGIDPTGDVAMFRLWSADPFPFAPLGDSDSVAVGDAAIAMGNPFMLSEDYTPTVTLGVVTGVHRYQWGVGNNLVYSDCIQVDTAINPGNSGGPLFNAAGEVIGINGRISVNTRGRFNVGFGYAISINQIRRFLPTLRGGWLARHGNLQATVEDLEGVGVVFNEVMHGAPAYAAGVRVGDRVLSLDETPIRSRNQFASLMGTYPANWPVTLVVEREGQRLTMVARLEAINPKLTKPFEETADVRAAAIGIWRHVRDAVRNAARSLVSSRVVLASEGAGLGRAIAAVKPRVVKLYGLGAGSHAGYGSGVLVSRDGLVLTVYSLLLDARTVRAVTADGSRYEAEVLQRDLPRQLALLRLRRGNASGEDPREAAAPAETGPFPFFELSCDAAASDEPIAVRPGDWLIAAGNPFKVADGAEDVSITRGVFSTRTRLDARRGVRDFPYHGDVLVVDAITSNPGAPGSAVVDIEGCFLGMVGREVVSNLTHTHFNHAIPRDVLCEFLQEAASASSATVRGGAPTEPKVHSASAAPVVDYGIRMSRAGYQKALPFVERVQRDSPASRAGLRKDDLILSVNGKNVADVDEFDLRMKDPSSFEAVELLVRRERTILTIRVDQR